MLFSGRNKINQGFGQARRGFRGQSMIEFVVVAAALAAALFVPVVDDLSGGRRISTIQLLISNLQQAYERTSGSLSLPE